MRAIVVAVLMGALSIPALAGESAHEPVLVAQTQGTLIDINRAPLEQLVALKGIGEARATAIIKGRPYARKDELVQRNIIPESVYLEIKDKIVAKQ